MTETTGLSRRTAKSVESLDDAIRRDLAWRTRPWQDRRGPDAPVLVPRKYGPERIRALTPEACPIATVDPDGRDLVAILDEARHFGTWIPFPHFDRLRRLPSTRAHRLGVPRFRPAWLSLAGTFAALAVAVPSLRLAFAVAAVTVGLLPLPAALIRYRRLRALWTSASPGPAGPTAPASGSSGSLRRAAREWSRESARDGRVCDPRYARLLAAAYFTDLADAWDRCWWRPATWFRAWRAEYPVLVVGPGPATPASNALVLAYAGIGRRSAVLVLPQGSTVRGGPVVVPPDRPLVRAPFLRPRSRRLILSVFIAVSLVGAGAAVVGRADSCDAAVSTVGGERVGFQLCGDPFGDSPWESRIYAENRAVTGHDERSGQGGRDGQGGQRGRDGREVLTVLLVTSLTGTGPGGSAVPESEGLAGAYAAQREINDDPALPLLRLAVVNAGARGLRTGKALDLVESFARASGNRVVGAMVTVDSTGVTRTALKRLDYDGLVQVSPTMTADGFGAAMHGFFPIGAPNATQADMVLRYATRLPNRPATLYTVAPHEWAGPGNRDLYVASLRHDVLARRSLLTAVGTTLAEVSWNTPDDDLSPACASPGRPTAVFFGGRYTDFAAFLDDLRGHCPARWMPEILAGSSVARFLTDPALAATVPFGVRVTVVTHGPLLSCTRYRGRQIAGAAWRRNFTAAIGRYLNRCTSPRPLPDGEADALAGGWAAGAYDAVWLLESAARRRSPGGVPADPEGLAGLRYRMAESLAENEITDKGVAGPIRFTGRVGSRGVWLYRVPELRTAFDDGRSPADDTAWPVARGGSSYETLLSR
ncbi:hypothetical protein [Actinoplanes sp. NPDC051851]|uniref:ABC transporter substrate-binding protein n=1 Tax=Actinoplanes sp. NPDC051851 TaxID=3154753 RepID=UPI003431A5F4